MLKPDSRKSSRPVALLGAAALSALAGSACAQSARLTDLGNFGQAWAVSADGSTVVGFGADSSGLGGAFRWSESGGMQILSQSSSMAYGVSADGSVVVGGDSAWRWTAASGHQSLGALGDSSTAKGVSASGSVVVGTTSTPYGERAFRWTPTEGMQSIGTLPGDSSSTGYAVSADGATVAGASGGHAFRWTASGGMQDIGALPGCVSAVAQGLSTDGVAVAGYCSDADGFSRAFRWWPAGGMEDLGKPPGALWAWAHAISGDRRTVVGAFTGGDGIMRASIWTRPLGNVDLLGVLAASGADVSGWVLHEADGVSADGTVIAGYGEHNGNLRPFVATLPTAVSCYANCDASVSAPALNVLDFTCFMQRFAAGQAYANCDSSTVQPVLNVADFTCFLQKYAQGCP